MLMEYYFFLVIIQYLSALLSKNKTHIGDIMQFSTFDTPVLPLV